MLPIAIVAVLVLAAPAGAARFEEEQLHAEAAIEAAMAMANPPDATGEEGSGDSRLPDDEKVLGLMVGTEPRAYALSELRRAGGMVRDVVGSATVWIETTEAGAVATSEGVVFEDAHIRSWAVWSALHRDTSLWRWSGERAQGSSRAASDVRIEETRSYPTAIGCALSQSALASGSSGQGLYVISGRLSNTTRASVHHVLLRFELLDGSGHVVYREDGYNRGAEALFAAGQPDAGAVEPVGAGASDSFRMILVAEELPEFASARVRVAAVY